MGTGGYTAQPFISLLNTVFQIFLSYPFNWKFNRKYVPAFLTVALQQDYLTQVTDLAWLEQAWRVDINNSTNNGNLAPKPIFTVETGRDQGQTSYQGYPFIMSFIPNSLAFYGQWFAHTAYGCGYGVAQTPISPIQQFVDKNGNFLYLDSTVLGLNINSPGFTGTPISLPVPNPYGTSGGTQPFAAVNAAAGTQVTDGTVTWTVAPQNGYAIRVSPLPAQSGLAWLMTPVYQAKPPIIASLQSTLSPIPDEYIYLFREGLLAYCYRHVGAPQANTSWQQWQESMIVAARGGDREMEEASFYPSNSITGTGSFPFQGAPIGAGWPYWYGGY